LVKPTTPLLSVQEVIAGYGQKNVIKGISLDVAAGETVALIGHNGAGKSTLLKAIFGLIPTWSGKILFNGDKGQKRSPEKSLKEGIIYVPQGNRVFTDLTVVENLKIAGSTFVKKSFPQEIEKMLRIFPSLRGKLTQRAGTLSGGEKQMLALANALILSPKLLLLDEPSLGLSQSSAARVFEIIDGVKKNSDISVIIVEQKVRLVLKIAQKVCIVRNGQISFWGSAASLDEDKLSKAFL
jgi:ABC-type branched-subunit amino acid transport system ATPase component